MKSKLYRSCFIAILFCVSVSSGSAEDNTKTFRGLKIAFEERCSPYERARDYSYSQSLEQKIVDSMGGKIYSPYTGACFTSLKQSDIDHIVATSEAHDSGLCSQSRERRKQFASDLFNLTLASPIVNRQEKRGYDIGYWQPIQNKCWVAERAIQVKLKYGLTVDPSEVFELKRMLEGCESTELVIGKCSWIHDESAFKRSPHGIEALALFDDDLNGQISCFEARKHGIAPVHSNHPAYLHMRYAHIRENDGAGGYGDEGDVIVCD